MIPPNNCDCEKCATDRMLKEVILVPFTPPDPALFDLMRYLTDKTAWTLPGYVPGLNYVRRWWQDDQLFEELIPAEEIFIRGDKADQIIQDDPHAPIEYTHESVSAPFMIDPAVADEALQWWDKNFSERINSLYEGPGQEAVNVNEMSTSAALQTSIVSSNPKAPFVKCEASVALVEQPSPISNALCSCGARFGTSHADDCHYLHVSLVKEIPPSADPSPSRESENPTHDPKTCPECQDDLIQGTLADQIAYYREVTRLRTEGAYRLIYSAKPYGQALFQTYLDAAGDIAELLALLERR